MTKQLHAIPFPGITLDTLGSYLCGLGLLHACTQVAPNIRGCWRDNTFHLLIDTPTGKLRSMDKLWAIDEFLLKEWKPPKYPGSSKVPWSDEQKQDTKKKTSSAVGRYRCEVELNDIRFVDSHIVSARHNVFNPIFGTGGNIARRNLAKLADDASNLSKDETKTQGWLANALYGEPVDLPELPSSGTWFPFANKTFNSGQEGFFREGRLSPWSFLLALEGALLLRGEISRRLSAIARPYAVFPFISEALNPISESNVGLKRAGVFWAPVWDAPATLAEVRALLKRGLARSGRKTATAPHEFAAAALGIGVDAGIVRFSPFELRETTSSKVFEAMPMPHILVRTDERSHCASELISSLAQWMARLPYEPTSDKKKGKFSGLRGSLEQTIIAVSEQPEDASRWQELLLNLSKVLQQIDWDRTRGWRQRSAPFPRLSQAWLDFAWPDGRSHEIEIAAAIASIGGGTLYPLVCNIYGVKPSKEGYWFPKDRPLSAMWHEGGLVDSLGRILYRRIIDYGDHGKSKWAPWPLTANYAIAQDILDRFLNGGIDDATVARWLPPLSLLDWSRPTPSRGGYEPQQSGLLALDSLLRPLLTADLPWKTDSHKQIVQPNTTLVLRLTSLLRQGDMESVLDLARARYRALNAQPVPLNGNGPAFISTKAQRLLAALLIPISRQAIIAGRARWILNTTD